MCGGGYIHVQVREMLATDRTSGALCVEEDAPQRRSGPLPSPTTSQAPATLETLPQSLLNSQCDSEFSGTFPVGARLGSVEVRW